MFRPIRPNPLIPTFTAIMPPLSTPSHKGAKAHRKTWRLCGFAWRPSLRPRIHLFYPYYLVPLKRHKSNHARRLAVDPVFRFFAILVFPQLVFRTPLGEQHHIAIHAHHNLLRLDRFLHLLGERLGVEFSGGVL